MPFTFAHPAAIVPLIPILGRWGVGSALAIGSMAPDFAHWLPLEITRSTSHSVPAIFWFCVPLGLAIFWFFHARAKYLIIALLPHTISCRLTPTPRLRWRNINRLAVVSSLALGAWTHLAWDAFTHAHAFFVRLFPILNTPLVSYHGRTLYTYKALQHISTLLGFGLLAYYGWQWWYRTPPRALDERPPLSTRNKAILITSLVLPTILISIGVGWTTSTPAVSFNFLRSFIRDSTISGFGVFMGLFALLSLLWPALEAKIWPSTDRPH